VVTEKVQLPEAVLYSPNFAQHFLANNTSLGFTALSGFDNISSDDGRSVEQVKADVYTDLREFASLDQKVKDQFIDPSKSGQRGYTPNQVERSGARPEYREHLMVIQDLPKGHPVEQYRPLFYSPNIPITAVSSLDENVQQLFSALEPLRRRMFEDVAIELGMWWGEFAAQLEESENFLRLHIYPQAQIAPGSARTLDNVTAIGGTSVNGVEVVDILHATGGEVTRLEGALRASPHPDVGFYTLLLGAEEPGLYIQLKNGKAMPFTTHRGKIVGNAADDAEVLIPKAKSVIHWVGLTEDTAKRPRYSIANFIHTRPMVKIGDEYAGVRLFRRLKEIGYDIPDFLTKAAAELKPEDQKLIGEILVFSKNEREAGRKPSGLERYYHLINPKTGSYGRIPHRAA